jgi:hypothetical protein
MAQRGRRGKGTYDPRKRQFAPTPQHAGTSGYASLIGEQTADADRAEGAKRQYNKVVSERAANKEADASARARKRGQY